MKKTGFRRNAIIPTPTNILNSKFDTRIIKPVATLCKVFKFVSFELNEKYSV